MPRFATLACLTLALPVTLAAQSRNVDWPIYGGTTDNTRYSTLDQITPANVASLQVAWTYDTHDEFPGSEFQPNPIVVDGVLYATTPKLRVIALDAATGREIWTFDPNTIDPKSGRFRHRGVTVYRDRVFVAQPDTATGRKLYLVYRLGPMLPDFGQIVIPTGVIDVPRPAQPGEAAVGRVVRMFDEMLEGQRLIPLDSAASIVSGRPRSVADGTKGMVRWVAGEPVLGTLQTYVVIDIARKDGLTPGDQIELYQPRQKPTEGRDLALPEIYIAKAQVLRVTERGATAIVIGQEQPKIEQGGAARISAKMP